MKQTAVEWLVEKLSYSTSDATIISHHKIITELVDQAKAMEKEQIIDAWNDGYREFYDGSSTPEEYYNQNFKSE